MNEAFSTDQLGRKNFGDRLTAYIGKQKLGTVIAIDAPWGQGKTWFATNWKQDLKEKNHEVVVIDAFHEDYIDDAFILLTRSIVGLLDANSHNRLTKSEFVTMGAKVAA